MRRRISFTAIAIISFVILGKTDCYSQSKEMQDSFDKINKMLKEYNVNTRETRYATGILALKDLKFSYEYPNGVISYTIAYAPGVTDVNPFTYAKRGKRVVIFPLSETNLSFTGVTDGTLYFRSESGIEYSESGKKELLKEWTLGGSSLLIKKLYTELNSFKSFATGYTGSLGFSTKSQGTSTGGTKKVIQMERSSDNTFRIPCKVNGLSLKFIFDTGASSVTLSLSEANFMLKNGYLSSDDILGKEHYQTASGAIQAGTKVILRKIEVNGLVLRNVEASIIHSDNAPLLLGQSALKQLGTIQIDYQSSTLTIISK